MQGTFKPHGYITLSNWGGIEVMIDESGDGVHYRFSFGSPDEEILDAEIEYDKEGNAFFRHAKTKYYLSEVMRIN